MHRPLGDSPPSLFPPDDLPPLPPVSLGAPVLLVGQPAPTLSSPTMTPVLLDEEPEQDEPMASLSVVPEPEPAPGAASMPELEPGSEATPTPGPDHAESFTPSSEPNGTWESPELGPSPVASRSTPPGGDSPMAFSSDMTTDDTAAPTAATSPSSAAVHEQGDNEEDAARAEDDSDSDSDSEEDFTWSAPTPARPRRPKYHPSDNESDDDDDDDDDSGHHRSILDGAREYDRTETARLDMLQTIEDQLIRLLEVAGDAADELGGNLDTLRDASSLDHANDHLPDYMDALSQYLINIQGAEPLLREFLGLVDSIESQTKVAILTAATAEAPFQANSYLEEKTYELQAITASLGRQELDKLLDKIDRTLFDHYTQKTGSE
ncbi:hypothetical protein, variant [Fonticula alba]|uniref:Uncharacterized protein n=1 Tax=Fonticula alba TaxID=691883 RepID=A0A058Z504_FONAL|nr:hypothetical protein, variant [Fonticula alba]KCV68978.1 hypothetical protein, variant [Fonticula alba]|eukprot:XP_009496549.1 hypothetical protein, variant [Fonticula alba]